MNDEIRKYGSSVGDDANDFINSILTKEEMAEVAFEAQLMAELTKARKEKRLTQKELGELCGLPQQTIARIEEGDGSQSISTVTKVLAVLEKRLYHKICKRTPSSTGWR